LPYFPDFDDKSKYKTKPIQMKAENATVTIGTTIKTTFIELSDSLYDFKTQSLLSSHDNNEKSPWI